jgi:prolyl-tRNA synthetase
MRLVKGIEVGHVFKLGTRYSEALGAAFLDSDGRRKPFVMGCYGIGINRILAALAESVADANGIAWPPAVAPYEVLVMPLDMSQQAVVAGAQSAHDALQEAGLEVLLDDRDERPGVKFHDAELIGLPVRVVVGKGYLRSGNLEVQVRRSGSRTEVPAARVAEAVREALAALSVHPPVAVLPPVR